MGAKRKDASSCYSARNRLRKKSIWLAETTNQGGAACQDEAKNGKARLRGGKQTNVSLLIKERQWYLAHEKPLSTW